MKDKTIEDVENKFRELNVFLLSRKGEGTYTSKVKEIVNLRVSALHKIQGVIYHRQLLSDALKKYGEILKRYNQSGVDFSSPENFDKLHALLPLIREESTLLVEDIVYHACSAIDNLAGILGHAYKNVPEGCKSFKVAKNSLIKQKHSEDLEIANYLRILPKNILELREYRAQIFHSLSRLNNTSHVLTLDSVNKTESQFWKIELPKEASKIFSEDKELSLEEFASKIEIELIFNYWEILDKILIDYRLHQCRMK